ncbi:unnamed protein product (macronuclear) [Paramecium tetraurelia]|uniref:Uncharacterized protein n=1 Tax=Paramecium tetraurelia TaxID=5888 RepID=A0E3B5_PARTE|nr:uncharacterized protein GSPATT00022955001 [Paramecium tetraurelia]CAK89782.1 unnamed protein product [Paramecium tetraurelia]|eukprot:XP_001457179.1 hypothetical protein (macronuclear) [Paramecium tetraurelia strain d4-2]
MLNFIRSFSQQKQPPKPPQQQQTQQQPKQNFYSIVPKLRDNFAEELFNLEMDVESDDVQMDTIMKLINLYKEAVEYFEAIHSNKYLIFKNKIQNLFAKKNVMNAMKMNQKKSPTLEVKQKLQQIKQVDQKRNADDLINQHQQKQEQLNTLIHNNLEAQNNVIQERLQKRRSSQVRQIQTTQNQETTDYSMPEFNPCHTPQIKTSAKSYRGRQTFDS